MNIYWFQLRPIIYLVLFIITVVDCRSISIEISHNETFAAEEFEEQDVIPTVDVLVGERLHVIKLGVDLTNDMKIIRPDIFTNQSMTSQSNATSSESTNQNYESDSVVKEEAASLDKLTKQPVDFLNHKHKSNLYYILTGKNLTTITPTTIDPVKIILARHRRRHKRQVGLDLNDIANEGWAYEHTTPADNSSTGAEEDSFQVISEADRDNARNAQIKTILIFTGSTLLTVLMFSAIAFCFLRDPKSCIVAFGTGCPCLLVVFPCVMKCLDKYLNPGRMVQESMNRYMPGVIIHEDGTIEKYDTTPEEIECIKEIIDEVMEM